MGLKDRALKIAVRGVEEFSKASGKIDTVKEVVSGAGKIAADIAAERAKEIKEANSRKPSTGSGILDAFVPAIPDTAATKPKAEKKKAAKKPPQP